MKNRITLTALLLFLLFHTTSARRLTFNLSDSIFGIYPDIKQPHLTSRLQAALETIRRQTDANDIITIKFKQGRYEFHANEAIDREYYVSNHDQNQPKRIGICIENWGNLTIDGCGSEFIFHGRMLPLALTACKNCRLQNFSIDFANPHIAQVEIIENSPETGTTFRVAPWVNYRIAENGRFETYGEGWAAQQSTGIAFEKDTHHIIYNTGDLIVDTRGLKQTDRERMLIAPNWHDGRLSPGSIVALRTWGRPAPAVFMENDTNTSLRNIQIHYAEGMGLLAQRCTDINLNGFSVCLRGKDDPRYFTTQADATHFSQCRGKIVATRGLYEGMMDDAINIHGIYLKVREQIDEKTFRCRYEHEQAWGFSWGDAGDSVRFIRSKTMETERQTYKISAIHPTGEVESRSIREFIITLDRPISGDLDIEQGIGLENLTWTPEVVFSHNTVRNNRARGALFSSPRHTVCEHNLFDHTSGTAILLCGDCNGWYESGAVHDIVIRKNKFINALTCLYQFTNAVISIYPEIPDLSRQKEYFHGGKPGAITIEQNYFSTFDEPLLYAKSVNGLTFKKNKIHRNADYKPFHPNRQPVWLEHVKNEDIQTILPNR